MPTNLKLKDGVDFSILLNYGFKPKYDVDTGEIIKYYRILTINEREKTHFTFKVYTNEYRQFFKRIRYNFMMSAFNWESAISKEGMELLFQLIKDDIVEIVSD